MSGHAACPHPSASGAGAALALRSISAARDGHPVLHDVSVEVPAGAVIAIVGANGSGKSTLLDVLAGVLPHAGSIEGMPQARALVVQRTAAGDGLPMTAARAVEMGLWRELGVLRRPRAVHRARMLGALEAVGMRQHAGRQLSALSGGQRQRILVAQGLVQAAPLLLLDEPTASADAASRDRIDAALAVCAAGGTAVVVATHDRASLARADHAVLLDGGRVVRTGAPAAVAAAQAALAAEALALG